MQQFDPVGCCARSLEESLLVQAEGFGMDDTNQLVVINGSCGDASAQVADETWNVANVSVGMLPSLANYSFGTPVSGIAGSFYRLCWGHDPRGNIGEFRVELDTDAELIGPFTRNLNCTLGISCAVVVSGYRLAATNAIAVIENTTCGSADAVLAVAW